VKSENQYLFKFAWKSIRRNAGRSFFIGFSVSLAVVIAVWVVSVFEGLNFQIEEAVVNTNTGFYQVQEPSYAKTTDSAHPLEFTKTIEEKLQDKRILSYSPELVLDSNISTPEGSAALVTIGIDPLLHGKFLPLKSKMEKGEFISADDEDSIVIGEELAQRFQFNPGDQLVLNFQDVKGELRSEILIIKGIFHYNSGSFEKRYVYISQKTWQKLYLNQDSGKILFNRIPIVTPSLHEGEFINQLFPENELKVKTWKNLNPEMAVVLEFHDGIIRFFFLVIGITVLMTILTPVQMLWQERFKELKMLTILGVSVKKFWKIGIFEIIQMIFVSSILSLILLVVIIGIQSKTGIDFRFLNDGVAIDRSGIKLPGIIYPLLTQTRILSVFIFVIFVMGLSYVWAIHRTLLRFKVEQ
jgi:ABC-type lipoprotein release transport system permease subunit